MSIASNGLVVMTDTKGKIVGDFPEVEPEPSSIVMTNGEFGTAWQRYFADGKWHRVGGGRARDWAWLLSQRNLVVVYDAPERKD